MIPVAGHRIDAPRVPAMPASERRPEDLRAEAWRVAGAVVDPEIPALSIADLGVLRDIRVEDGAIEIFITPTYSGCPAMNVIAIEIALALARSGLGPARITTVLSPAWTTEWMSQEGRRKLREYGVAPPQSGGGRRALFGVEQVNCPRCESADTTQIAEFGSTSCKALWRCNSCREPFDYFKCH